MQKDPLLQLRADYGPIEVPHSELRELARRTRISYFTLRKLAKGYTVLPSYTTAEALRREFASKNYVPPLTKMKRARVAARKTTTATRREKVAA